MSDAKVQVQFMVPEWGPEHCVSEVKAVEDDGLVLQGRKIEEYEVTFHQALGLGDVSVRDWSDDQRADACRRALIKDGVIVDDEIQKLRVVRLLDGEDSKIRVFVLRKTALDLMAEACGD